MADPQPSAQLLPYDKEAEQSVLGAILHNNDALLQVAGVLAPDQFFSPAHRDLFTAMLELAGRKDPIDEITLANFLRSHNQLEQVGGMVYIAELVDATPASLNIRAYAEIVLEKWQVRAMIGLCQRTEQRLRETPHVTAEQIETLRDEPVRIMATRLDLGGVPIAEGVGRYVQNLNAIQQAPARDERPAMKLGLHKLDGYLGRLSRSRPIVIAARPGFGKTALGRQVARTVASYKHPALYVNLEMDEDELHERDIAALTGFDSKVLRGFQRDLFEDEQWDRIATAQAIVHNMPLYTYTPTAPMTGPRIEAVIRWHIHHYGIELVVVDQLSKIVSGARGNDFERQTARMRSVTRLVKQLGIPLILLCQLGRAAEEGRGGLMGALKSSGQIEEDAHALIFLHEIPPKTEQEKASYNQERPMVFLIPKNGGGAKGRFRMLFRPRTCEFIDPETLPDAMPAFDGQSAGGHPEP